MSVSLLDLPKGILWFIAQYVWNGRPRGRWATYAVFRSVCKRFRESIPLNVLYGALGEDFNEFPMVCLYNGLAFERKESLEKKHQHYRMVAPYSKAEERIMMHCSEEGICKSADIHGTLPQNGAIISVRAAEPLRMRFWLNSHKFLFTTILPKDQLKEFLSVLLEHLYTFRRHASREGADPWLAVSSTYHIYIRSILEGDESWKNKVEVKHEEFDPRPRKWLKVE